MGGINCNENGLINATDFVKNNLTGTLPPEVVALPELSVFRLVRSTFSGTIPSPYSDLYWGLTGNLIDLSKMSRLKQLRLGQNRLGGYRDTSKFGMGEDKSTFLDLSWGRFRFRFFKILISNLSAYFQCNQLLFSPDLIDLPSALLSTFGPINKSVIV